MERVYFPNLNSLRFVAALSVMVYHFFGKEVIDGRYGVTLFFVLSGFLITYLLLLEQDKMKSIVIKKFYVRRILRIWPLYFLITIVGSGFYIINSDGVSYWSEGILYYLIFLPNLAFVLDLGLSYASVLWSVGAEEQFYLVWPWILKVFKGNRLLYFLIFLMISWTVSPYFIDFINAHFFSGNEALSTLSRFITKTGFHAMSTGAIFAYLFFVNSKLLEVLYSKWVEWGALITIAAIWIGGFLPQTMIVDELYALLFGVVILNFSTNPVNSINLEIRPFVFLGKISFGLYVYHLIAFDLIEMLPTSLFIDSSLVIFTLGTGLTICMAYISYEFLEKPFLKLKTTKFTTIRSGVPN